MEWRGKTALVTGASRGIGVYIVQTLAEKGIVVAGVARSESGLNETRKQVENSGGTFHSFPWDLTRINGLPELIQSIKAKLGPIDFLINNAGIERYRPYYSVNREELEGIVRTNLLAPMELTRLVLPVMLEQGRGHIVTIASLAGKKGVAYNSIYSATKGGIVLWTDGLRQELRDTGVDISVICPGFIAEAGMFHDSSEKPPSLLGASPPQKVAEAVVKALETGSVELIVNRGPIRPLLALNQLFPKFGDWVVKQFGVMKMNRRRAES